MEAANSTENISYEEKQFPSAMLTAVSFDILTAEDQEKLSVLEIEAANEVTNPRLGIPNHSSQCTTCDAKNYKSCEGHFGLIKLSSSIVHPFFMSEVVQILNKVCPGCKFIRRNSSTKGGDPSKQNKQNGCKYCTGNSRGWYPRMKFKVSSAEMFRRATIIAEASERLPKNSKSRLFCQKMAADYWDVIPKDEQEEENVTTPNKRVLTQAQIYFLLKDVDQDFIKRHISRTDSIFLNSFSVTPNNHRVTEVSRTFANGQRLIFDDRTRAYKKLVDFRGTGNDLSFRVLDCLRTSKINPEKEVNNEYYTGIRKRDFDSAAASGLRWIKDAVLGKRNDHSFRMVVVGDPSLKLSEVGIPCHIAERLQISEYLTTWNWEKLNACCEVQLLQKGEILVHREGNLVRVRRIKELRIGDIIYRHLQDGDIVLINRPPSIHQHSLIALSVKVLPVAATVAINPLCCSPFYADFDGDCLHGYIPQSVETKVELSELIALDKQLTNLQSGRNLLSLSQDSLTAAHLLLDDVVTISLFQMQQLQMYCAHKFSSPAILKAPSLNSCVWTGKQLISMLLPRSFNHEFPKTSLCIRNGELISSQGSFWLREADGNLFQGLVKECRGQFLDTLYAAQEVLSEWLSVRGLSVSLSDLYLCSDSNSRKNMTGEIFFGLQEAEGACNLQQLLVDSKRDFLAGDGEEAENAFVCDVKNMCYGRQRSAALSQFSLNAFTQVFRDMQSLVYKYASNENAFITMMKAGSKGNLQKLVQHGMCLGMQHSLVPLSFRMPHRLSCAAWSNQKFDDSVEFAKRYIPSAVVENSFLTGLNPSECFIHSVTSRESSFSDNADLPGTLTRRLMFFMRDLYAAYDSTVRNTYGNQLVQFSYGNDRDASTSENREIFDNRVGISGQGVGTLAACAISEAAYSALDQPVSLLGKSPLLNLKNIMECGSRRKSTKQTISLFLSGRLGREWLGFEYAALEIRNHLEKLLFSDVVFCAMIIFSPKSTNKTQSSPWVCHFHIYKEIVRKRKLKIQTIIDALYKRCKSENGAPKVEIVHKACFESGTEKEKEETFCITVSIIEKDENSSTMLETVQDLLIPFLLGTVLKGLVQIKKVDILWNDKPKVPKLQKKSRDELYLRVHMSGKSDKTKLWNLLVNECIPMMDMIDWTRSHPDNVHDFCMAYGIEAGWKFFLNNLEAAMSDIGKTVLPEHLLLVADSLSVTGEFVGLNAEGLRQQREQASVLSPFVQACFSNPGRSFIKAAKSGVTDSLMGCLDALVWGRIPPIGTGQFDIVYSDKSNRLSKTGDIYSILASSIVSDKQNAGSERPKHWSYNSDKCGAQFDGSALKGFKPLKSNPTFFLKSFLSYNDILRLSRILRRILNRYSIDEKLNESDKGILNSALYFHPRRDEKIGVGAIDFKVINHPEHQDTRCFCVVKADGTTEDFSYLKCVHAALEIVAPEKAKGYRERYLQGRAL